MRKAFEYYADTILDYIVYIAMAGIIGAAVAPGGTVTNVFNNMFTKMGTYTS